MTIDLTIPGIHRNLPRETYDALAPRVNFSTLKAMAKSAAHYQHGLLNPSEDTPARKVGRAVHMAVFEPEVFAARVVRWDGGTRRGKEWDAFRAAHSGQEILTEAEHAQCLAIQRAVRGDALAARYVTGGAGEVTMVWERDGIPCKGRIDYDAIDCIVDLKTCRDASPGGFGRSSWVYGYHTQAAWYVDGYQAAAKVLKDYVLLAVESSPPHVVQVYRVPESVIDVGRETYSEWLDKLAACRKSNEWPGYVADEAELILPKWAGTYEEESVEDFGLVIGGA